MPVLCNKISRGKLWPVVPDMTWMRINVCSSSGSWSRGLSPMLVGPIEVENITVKNIENLWQQSKVYPFEVDEKTGEPSAAFFARRNANWQSDKAMRYVKVKGRGSMKGKKFAYIYWRGKHLDYVEGRRVIYVPHYVEAVTRTPAWQRLKSLYDSGKNLMILGYDGRPYEDLDVEWNRADVPFGHELVLCAMLTGRIDLKTGQWIEKKK